MNSYKQQYHAYIVNNIAGYKKDKLRFQPKKGLGVSSVTTIPKTLPKQEQTAITALISFIDKLIKRTQCCRNNIKLKIKKVKFNKKKKQEEYNPIIKQLEELEKKLVETESHVKYSKNKKEQIDENRILSDLLSDINSYNENIEKLIKANNSIYQVSYNKKNKCSEQIEDCVINLFIDLHREFTKISYLPLPTDGEYQNYLPNIVKNVLGF